MLVFLSLAIMTFTWGIGNILVKSGFKKLTPWQTYALDSFYIAFPMWLIYGMINYQQIKIPTPMSFIAALFTTIVYTLFYHTISQGQIGLTSPIIATYPVATLILAYLFLGERLSAIPAIGIISAIAGIILISIPSRLQKIKSDSWIFLSIVVSAGYGISGYLSKLAINEVGNVSFLILLAVFQILVVLVWQLFIKESFPRVKNKESKNALTGVFLYNIGNIAYYVALESGIASIVVPLSNSYILITVLLSFFWLKEKISRHQFIGILFVVTGIILVGLYMD